MKKITLLLFLLISTFRVISQTCPIVTATGGTIDCSTPCTTMSSVATPIYSTTNYSLSTIPYSPYSYTSGTTITSTTDDVYTSGITLPFCFEFFGASYNTVYIGSNGNISFSSVGGAFDPWSLSGPLPGSNSAATKNAIMSPLCDIYPPGGGNIRYSTYGTAPCRTFVVSFDNLTMYLPGTYCTGDRETSQIVLYETSNIIDIYIGSHNSPTLCTSWNSGYAVTGIENPSGSTFYTATGENGTAFSATNEGWRFTPNGTVYPWIYSWMSSTGPTGPTVCPTTTNTYTSTATTTTLCGILTLTTTTTVNVVSTPISVLGPSTICQGTTNLYSTTGSGGSWSSTDNTVASVDPTGNVSGLLPGFTYIRYINGLCSDSILINVNPSYHETTDASICQGQSYIFAGNTYTSSGTFINNFLTSSGCDSILTLNLNVLPVYNNTIDTIICQGDTVKISNNYYTTSGIYINNFTSVNGCDSTVTLNLDVNPLPSLGFYLRPSACIGDTIIVALTSHSYDIINYTWIWPSTTNIITSSSDNGGPFTISFNTGGTYTISVSATNEYCKDSVQDTIRIDYYPDASIDLHDNNVCFGSQVLFRAYNIQYGDYYIWGPQTSFYQSNASDLHNAWAYGIIDSNEWITLTVETPYGCKLTDSTYINAHSCCELEVPTAFTPNDDGLNDKFGPIGQYYQLNDFRVVNRYGQVIFETMNIGDKWDGKFNGVPQDIGTYFWYIIYDCDGKQIIKKGDVTLIR